MATLSHRATPSRTGGANPANWSVEDAAAFARAQADEMTVPPEKRPLFRELASAQPFPIDALGPLKDAALAIHNISQAPLADEQQKDHIVESLKGKCDILLGGPPCQGFSTLGKRKDGDKRSTLVDHFADMANRAQPKIILLENVRGITSKRHPTGGTYWERCSSGFWASRGPCHFRGA